MNPDERRALLWFLLPVAILVAYIWQPWHHDEPTTVRVVPATTVYQVTLPPTTRCQNETVYGPSEQYPGLDTEIGHVRVCG